ncbi:MAG: hypothetical protein ACKN89_16515 [Cyanobium sp.]|jgi:hypothetical protein
MNQQPTGPADPGRRVRPAAADGSPASPLSGSRVLVAGLVTGAIGLLLAFFLQAIVANTPVRLSSRSLFWSSVLLGCIGMGAGMALESVRQLSQNNPDPAYRRSPRGRPPGPR